jgi:hypothetical protein
LEGATTLQAGREHDQLQEAKTATLLRVWLLQPFRLRILHHEMSAKLSGATLFGWHIS